MNEAKQLLKDEKIKGYYLVSDKIELVVNDTGIDETILESIANEYNSTMSTIKNITDLSPDILQTNILDAINLSKNNFKTLNISGNTDLTVVYFYTLIGMNCLNASFIRNFISFHYSVCNYDDFDGLSDIWIRC